MDNAIFLGGGGQEQDTAQWLRLDQANRHGLVAGATGTGKTVTLQILAEGFANAGVPVFAADVKGDLSGICQAGSESHKLHPKLIKRATKIGFDDYAYSSIPTIFWDVFGKNGHPVRATIGEMGAQLLSRLLDLNETQEGVVNVAFAYARDQDLPLIELADLQKLILHMANKEIREEVSAKYGNTSAASLGAIQRRLLVLEQEGAEAFFGEPALRLPDLMRTNTNGQGYVNVLDATDLINSPRLYSTFLLWLLTQLFEQLPEVGDPEKPKLVFFFDEAHLLFNDSPKALMEKIEQVVRLIRSKGVGVFFVTQNPRDLPESVLAQLGNRIQHALRAYTPSERKAVRAAAQSFRENPLLDTEAVITDLGIGEALVSMLDEDSAPSMVERTLIRPPASRLGPASEAERKAVIASSPIAGQYETERNRESALEIIEEREEDIAQAREAEAKRVAKEKEAAAKAKASTKTRRTSRSRRDTAFESGMKSAMRTAAREITRYLLRGITGGKK